MYDIAFLYLTINSGTNRRNLPLKYHFLTNAENIHMKKFIIIYDIFRYFNKEILQFVKYGVHHEVYLMQLYFDFFFYCKNKTANR